MATQMSDTFTVMNYVDSLCSLEAALAMRMLLAAGTIALACWSFVSMFFCICNCRSLGCWTFGRDARGRETTVRRLIQGTWSFYHSIHLTKVVFVLCKNEQQCVTVCPITLLNSSLRLQQMDKRTYRKWKCCLSYDIGVKVIGGLLLWMLATFAATPYVGYVASKVLYAVFIQVSQ